MMKIAVEGCCHGELDTIYSQISRLEAQHHYKVDLLLICGDFQAVRNHADLQCMAVPNKYKELKDFHKYYSGQKTAPILTIVIGGNHEASNYMWELYHGGWLAPNIYFLGHAGSVLVNGIRVSGASGIFKSHDFPLGSYEKLPYDSSSMRSIYHIREFCVRKLSLLPSSDIFLSHDWPHQIEHYGNLPSLLARKNFLRTDIDAGRLGSPPLMGLLMTLQPNWWFAAHLHVRYEAAVIHGASEIRDGTEGQQTPRPELRNPDEIVIDEDEDGGVDQQEPANDIPSGSGPPFGAKEGSVRNPDEITLEDEEEDVAAPPAPLPQPSITKFLALDKCLPKRQFLEIIDIDINESQNKPSLGNSSQDPHINPDLSGLQKQPQSDLDTAAAPATPILAYDPAWLAITRAFHPYFSLTRAQLPFPDEQTARASVETELAWVMEHVPKKLGGWEVVTCQQFWRGVPDVTQEPRRSHGQPPCYTNPQTEAFCSLLEIENKVNPRPASQPSRGKS